MIELVDVKKSFGDVRALDGVSFKAEDGKITGLLGPNGAGKTTALRILYTVLQQDTGHARIDGFDTRETPREVQKRIGVLPDTHGLYPRLTSRENIAYFGRLHGLEGEELERNIDELMALLDMEEIADRRTEGFSTGQRIKVLLSAYSQQIGALRLQARGVDPRIIDAIAIELADVSTPQSQAARILSMAPYLILVSLFVGGMYLAIDSTAGERERGSLEPLLINPVSRSQLVAGKAAAVLLFTAVALVETLVGFAIILNYVPMERYIGVRMQLTPDALLSILLLCLPLMVENDLHQLAAAQ